MDQQILDQKVEQICQLGCVWINELIEEIQSGGTPDEVMDFSSDELGQVLQQLESIMSVYD